MIPIVISGGSGTRLWPTSRERFPKQFCDFFDQSLQEKTTSRLKEFGSPWVLTVEALKTLTERSLQNLSLPVEQAIYEPFGRNTAPAVALACQVLQKRGLANEIAGVFPADHLIENEKAFADKVRLAIECAEKNEIVTLGILPTYPATGYGYIEIKSDTFLQSGSSTAHIAKRFCEKPDLKTAEAFLDAGNYLWNAGMFVFRISKMIDLFRQYQPVLWQQVETLESDLSNIAQVYEKIEGISLDYAIMEKLDQLVCIPSEIGWSDVGSWEELAKVSLAQKTEPSKSVIEVSSKDNFVKGESKKVYGLIDVEGLIVVDTPDALLVSKKGSSQKVKEVVEKLKENSFSQVSEHGFDIRPWGRYDVLADNELFKAKVIEIKPGQRLSYQSHQKRAEHWIVVEGSGTVTLDGEERTVKSGDYIHIPLQAKHRMAADSRGPLKFVEVQTGDYFGEDDITRYSDDYKRS